MGNKNVILSGKEITKSYGNNVVLQGISMELYAGDFTVIMGSSGSGKSTLLYVLSGMDRLTEGRIFYREREITKASEKELETLRAGEFGFVFQRAHLVSNLTLEENIRIAGLVCPFMSEQEVRERTAELIDRMGLSKAAKRLPSQVSGGEAQRAAVARALMGSPAVLFADEPTGALNRANTVELLNLLTAAYDEGQTVLLVTHDREAALRGSRILYLEDGAITGELQLAPYQGRDEARENRLTHWLEGFRW
ncbi:MAG: ABC transporter ATP-binding protein [Lachnospiraceae bacterium]|nr:ABC transporter ATP-binding protein [Lachnospiraceae bacterium]